MSALLTPFSQVYGVVALARARLYQRGSLKQHRLSRPVISVGNLSVGGTGKTPLVALMARMMLRRGLRPSILTRGYRRRSPERLVALSPASSRQTDPRVSGDEAALLASALPEIPIVISRDRYQAGQFAEEKFQVDVHLLDDGFQHLRLARTLDIVALDATQALLDQRLLPAGRLREPLSALRRADLMVLTRTELADSSGIEETIRHVRPDAPVFHSQVSLVSLVDAFNGASVPAEALAGRRVFAFCGIGNPRAFFQDLERWGFKLSGTRTFHDHHVYGAADSSALIDGARRAGAEALVTTEKDLMNFHSPWGAEIPRYACAIQLEMRESEAFERAVLSRLSES